MRNALRGRLEKLEAVLAPAGRYFLIDEADEPAPDARIAEFKAENNVKPQDNLVIIRIRYQER
jgi:hypothetical protein